MILPDVNVLIYAFRQDAPQHGLCRAWLEREMAGDSRFGISPLTLTALVRITTLSRSGHTPSSVEEALRFCDYILEQPNCSVVEPGAGHWEIFKRLCSETGSRGGLVTDAWYAALAIEWGCEWITLDRDFARFPGLKWNAPSLA
jgi:toxin-antitoxin system PIN domain toxin